MEIEHSSTTWFLFIKAKWLYCNLVMICYPLNTNMICYILVCFLIPQQVISEHGFDLI